MLTRLLIFLCEVSPFLRKTLWHWWYGKLARQIAVAQWTFMNYGYAPGETSPNPLPLHPEDEPDRYCIQLYQHVVSPASLKGAQVLEVGSGRGGGASYLARYHLPAKYTGVDFSSEAVRFCRNRHRTVTNLEFTVGDAENLPFPDQSFDVVVNVESSHCYGNLRKFYAEVARVLRPGGYFVYADLCSAQELDGLKSLLLAQPHWQLIEQEDLTANVLAALQADNARKRQMIAELIPPRLRPLFEEFAGIEGGKVCRNLAHRELVYFRFAFRRQQNC